MSTGRPLMERLGAARAKVLVMYWGRVSKRVGKQLKERIIFKKRMKHRHW